MLLNKIELHNFRKYETLSLELKKGVNILIGGNGSGKTSVLEGIKITVGSYFLGVNSMSTKAPSVDKFYDVHFKTNNYNQLDKKFPVELKAEAILFNQSIKWSRELRTAKGRLTTENTKELKERVSTYINTTENGCTLSILAYYSTKRLHIERKKTKKFKKGERFDAYFNSLEASSSNEVFRSWFENQEFIAFQKKVEPYGLKVVKEAIKNCISDCVDIYYDGEGTEIVLKFENNAIIPITHLSAGYQLIVSMISDLAYRCAMLNPHKLGMCLKETPGVVLIDEIEMHLHPEWQTKIVNALHETFPLIQFVLSTHSPIILNSSDAHIIRLDGSDKIIYDNTTKVHAKGRSIDNVLYEEQGVDTIDADTKNNKNKFYKLISSEEGLDEATVMYQDFFVSQFGENDPETVAAKRALEFAIEDFD